MGKKEESLKLIPLCASCKVDGKVGKTTVDCPQRKLHRAIWIQIPYARNDCSFYDERTFTPAPVAPLHSVPAAHSVA